MKKEIEIIAKEVIQFEINALKNLKKSISKSFTNVVEAILNCKNGKIVISGVGKSGIIARKWAATLSSTGTSSFYMDASNASHGDMGQITSNDVVVLISNSGQSEELNNIIQYTSGNKKHKARITSKKDSILFKNSDIPVLLPTYKAGPERSFYIIYYSSTTLECYCNSIMNTKISKIDFKKIHPSGTLSIKLKPLEI